MTDFSEFDLSEARRAIESALHKSEKSLAETQAGYVFAYADSARNQRVPDCARTDQ